MNKIQEPFVELYRIPIESLKYKINFLNNIESNESNLATMIEKFFDLSKYLSICINYSVFYPYLFRVRKTHSDSIEQLIHLPKERVDFIGRCNNKKESFFYCSNFYATSLLEVRPKVGDKLTLLVLNLIEFQNNQKFWINAVPTCNEVIEEDLMLPFIGSGNKEVQQKIKLILNFFNKVIMEKDCEKYPELYYKSIALIKCLQQKFSGGSTIIYPSFASKLAGVNFAIPGEWVDKIENPKYLGIRLIVKNKNSDDDFEFEISEVAENVINGKLIYRKINPLSFNVNKETFASANKRHQHQKSKMKEGSFYHRIFIPPFYDGNKFTFCEVCGGLHNCSHSNLE